MRPRASGRRRLLCGCLLLQLLHAIVVAVASDAPTDAPRSPASEPSLLLSSDSPSFFPVTQTRLDAAVVGPIGAAPYRFVWTFGDGSPPLAHEGRAKPADTAYHTYGATGRYVVLCNVSSAAPGHAVANTTGVVVQGALTDLRIGTPGNASSLRVGELYEFRAVCLGCELPPLVFHWTFGDNTTARIADTPVARHRYTAPGVYAAQLRAENAFSFQECTQLLSVEIPIAQCRVYTTVAAAPTTASRMVVFHDGSPPVSFVFDFGDNTTLAGTDRAVTHTYAAPGTYVVTVYARNNVSARSGVAVAVVGVAGTYGRPMGADPSRTDTARRQTMSFHWP